MMGMDMMDGFGWLGMGLMWLWALLPVALVIGVGWRGAGSRDRRQPDDDAAAILGQRLAAGEIDIEQYENARAALGLPGGKLERDATE